METLGFPFFDPNFLQLQRTIVKEDVRVTCYPIKWDEEDQDELSPEQGPVFLQI